MQQWVLNYWETYSPVVNWISVRSLLAIASIHGSTSIKIDFVLSFTQYDLNADVFMELTLEMGVDANKGELVLNFN